ncbi:hypothetical protein ACQUEF_14400 [Vagococcus fluvialis]|uniref:hypothetical protein n=1 Tax=Vagococcus fluvialis TaxID=2738 RepID=UPI003D0D73E6
MNELVYVKDNYNVISACFVKNNQISSRLYAWYLPHYYLDKVYVNDVVQIKVKGKIKRVRIINLTHHPLAKTMYKSFPIIRNQSSWQIRYICRLLERENITYYRERCFKGLKNIDGKPLRVDISFRKDERWHLIEYHGVHHYYRLCSTPRRFKNIRRIMEIKKSWSVDNEVPYLEIPFFRQNEIKNLLIKFLKGKTI